MARIKIADLPLLQDLSEEQLKELFGAGPRTYKPTFDALEDRQLMSGFGSVLPTLSAVTFQQGAQVALNFSQPIQVIPQTPLAPAGSNSILDQNLTLSTSMQPRTPSVGAAIVNQSQPTDTLVDYGKSALPAPGLATVRDGHSGPTPHILTFDQEQGRVAIANKVAQLLAGTQITSPVAVPALGSPLGDWGNPSGASQPTTDGVGRMQAFQGGNIYWSPVTAKMDIERGIDPSIAGAHFIQAGAMRDKFYTQGGTQWGYPTTDTSDLPGAPGTTFNSFYTPNNDFATTDHQRDSMIVSTPGVGTFVMSGETMYKWIELGAGKYGVPTSEKAVQQFGAIGVYSQNFRWGGPGGPAATIFWSGNTGAHDLVGQTLETYRGLGGPLGIGTPTTDSTVAMRSGPNALNSVVHFRQFILDDPSPHDSALGTTNNNTYMITGSMYTAWYSSGGINFGMPISSEHNLDAAGYYRYMYFVSPAGKARSIVWATAPPDDYHGSGPIFFIDNLDGGGLQRSYAPPISGPTGFEQIEGPTGKVSTPLTVTYNPNTPTRKKGDPLSAFQSANTLVDIETYGLRSSDTIWTDAVFQSGNGIALDPSLVVDLFGALVLPGNSGAQPLPPLPSRAGSPSAPALLPDLTGVTFNLIDNHGNQAHQLVILTEGLSPNFRPEVPGTAKPMTFTGLWDPADGGGSPVAGTLSQDATGNVLMHFTWAHQADRTFYIFDGVVTGAAGSYHLSGTAVSGPVADHHLNLDGDQAPAPVAPVADLTGVTFAVAEDSGTAHQLQVTTQAAQPDGSATFVGVWDGQTGSGTLVADAAGSLQLTFKGDDGSTVVGLISGTPGAYQLDGQYTSPDGQVVHVGVAQTAVPVTPVPDFTNVSFALAEGNGTAHLLQITTPTLQPDGSATFTGALDGQNGTGTLAYDAAGNLLVTFSGDSESLTGTLSGNPGAYHLDASLTLLGAAVGVTGDQAPGASPIPSPGVLPWFPPPGPAWAGPLESPADPGALFAPPASPATDLAGLPSLADPGTPAPDPAAPVLAEADPQNAAPAQDAPLALKLDQPV